MLQTLQKAIEIRPAHGGDVALLAEWAQAMAFETEHKRLDPDTITRGITEGVADPARSRYFIAEIGGEPVGTLMFTFEWSDWRCAWWWWLQSVYVPPAHRRKGVYRTMYEHVQALAAQAPDVCGIRLYVERGNIRAQRTYESLGMNDAGYWMFESEFPSD
jgi:GNAT superfamily N-acetyltransferase